MKHSRNHRHVEPWTPYRGGAQPLTEDGVNPEQLAFFKGEIKCFMCGKAWGKDRRHASAYRIAVHSGETVHFHIECLLELINSREAIELEDAREALGLTGREWEWSFQDRLAWLRGEAD